MNAAEREGRICNLPIDRGYPVHTARDLGIDDSMAIWCRNINSLLNKVLSNATVGKLDVILIRFNRLLFRINMDLAVRSAALDRPEDVIDYLTTASVLGIAQGSFWVDPEPAWAWLMEKWSHKGMARQIIGRTLIGKALLDRMRARCGLAR
jgi:hypothetical protein